MFAEFFPLFLSLSLASASTEPVFDFDYEATTSYGISETFSGTAFYELEQPRIQIGADYCLDALTCGSLYFDSGYRTAKQTKSPTLIWTPQVVVPLGESVFLEILPTLTAGGDTQLTACTDSIGREFHCYYGTQPSSALFYRSFEEIKALYSVPDIRLSEIEITVKWVF